MAVQPRVTAGDSRQRLLLLLLAAVAVIGLAMLLAGPLLLGRQAASTAPAPATVPAGTATTTPQLIGPSSTLAPGGQGTVGAVKDPFRPLVSAGVAAGAGGPAAASTPTTGPTVQSTIPGAGAGTATAPGGGAVVEQKVTLLDIVTKSGTRAAAVEVDGTRYTVSEGESFAGSYRAVDVGSSCATFESSSTPFTLCEGEAVLK
jgi:hypothetical protein